VDSEGRCVHDILTMNASNSTATVVAVNLNRTETGSYGFMLGLDSTEQPIIKHVEPSVPLKKGDRFVTIDVRI
jgi:hypothetical protein